MAKIYNKLAKKLGFENRDNIVYGRLNEIYVNVRFNKVPRKGKYMSVMDRSKDIKYDSVNIDVYAYRKEGVDLKEINKLLEMSIATYTVNKASLIDGRLSLFLFKNTNGDIKVSYVMKFLDFFTKYLSSNEYYSACSSCGNTNGLSKTYENDIVKEVCEGCLAN